MKINHLLLITFLWCTSASIHGAAPDRDIEIYKLKALQRQLISDHESRYIEHPGTQKAMINEDADITTINKITAAIRKQQEHMISTGFSQQEIQNVINQVATEHGPR